MLGENVAKLRTDLMKEQLSTFRSQLEDFARKHKVPTFSSFLFLIFITGNYIASLSILVVNSLKLDMLYLELYCLSILSFDSITYDGKLVDYCK